MSYFVVVPKNHAFMMNAPEVATQTAALLRTGHLDHGVPRASRADALIQKYVSDGGLLVYERA